MLPIENSRVSPDAIVAFLELNQIIYRRFHARNPCSDAVVFQAFSDYGCYILIHCQHGYVQSDCIIPVFSERELEPIRSGAKTLLPPVVPLPFSPADTSAITGTRFMTKPELFMLRRLIRLQEGDDAK